MKKQPKPRRLPSILPPGPGFPPSFLPDPNFPVFFFHPIQTSLLIQPNQSLLNSPSFFNTTQTSVLLSIRPRSLSFLPLDPNLPRFSFFFFFALPQMSPGKGSGFSGIKNIYTFTLVQMAATARNKKSVLYQEIIRWTLNHTYSRRHSGFLYYWKITDFLTEIYQVSAPAQWGSWEDLSCCHSSSVTLSNSCYPHSIQCASSSDVYNRAHAWWRYPISHPEDGVLIKY